MSTLAFDTQELVRELAASGIPPAQADAVVRALVKSRGNLVTLQDMQIELAPIRSELTLRKWIAGMILAGVASLVLKAFF